MANEIKSQIATRSGINLPETLLRDASQAPQATLNNEIKPIMPVCLYLNQKNGIQLPAAIGASQLEDNTYGMNVRASIRDEGILTLKEDHTIVVDAIGYDYGYFYVPYGKLWNIKRLETRGYDGTITYTLKDIEIYDTNGNNIILNVSTGADITYEPSQPLYLPYGWYIKFSAGNSAVGVAGHIQVKALYQEIQQ